MPKMAESAIIADEVKLRLLMKARIMMKDFVLRLLGLTGTLAGAIVFLYVGIRLITNNEIVTKRLLRNAGIFSKKKNSSREEKAISPTKLKSSRIMTYIVGVIFIIWGGFVLLGFLIR